MPQFRDRIDAHVLQTALLDWYDTHARDLPWRIGPNQRDLAEKSDPYRVWLSEIMLQQTTVAAVKAYFERFTDKWQTVQSLAAAPLDDVLTEWAGLGYYARARNLHKCAGLVANEYGGVFPETEADLLKLPGIGPYTAAAISSIAFDRRATILDGNVERVMSRLFAIEDPLPASKKILYSAADALTPQTRPGDYAQAVMDLGATICTPRSPACGICPIFAHCEGRKAGIAGSLPRKTPKKAKPTRYGIAFVAVREDGAILLDRRPETGLLGGMMEAPGSEWTEGALAADASDAFPIEANWRDVGEARHTFTHFHLKLNVLRANIAQKAQPIRGRWLPKDEAMTSALPTVMKKVLKVALD